MAEDLTLTQGLTRAERYQELLPQIEGVISAESDLIANLANVAAILKEGLGFFWVGFYRMMEGELVLGPFQGPLACTRIALDRGVCGACATQRKTLIVPDVEKFPGHIACSSLSRSEIVLPLIAEGKVQLVLDVDSEQLDDFSETDQHYLELVMALLKAHHWSGSSKYRTKD
jgi:L-methionine (R)-S-oxide reductase